MGPAPRASWKRCHDSTPQALIPVRYAALALCAVGALLARFSVVALGVGGWLCCCDNIFKESSLMTELDLHSNAFKHYRPLASAHSFTVRRPDDKVSNTGQEEPATTVLA